MDKPNNTGPQTPPSPRTLEAEELVLKDAAGRVGGRLKMTPIGSQLVLCGESGKPRATLSVLGEQPALLLQDDIGTTRAALILVDGEPFLNLDDASGKRRAALGWPRAGFSLGYAALVCWAALLLFAPTIVRGQFGGPMGLLGGALALGGILLTALWVRYRLLWWKTKGRAMAAYVADSEGRDSERQEAEHARRDAD